MAIKAKTKASAPKLLYRDFWWIFFTKYWVFPMDYHHKKFHAFLWPISRFRGVGGMKRERAAWIFQRFFIFRPSFPIEKVQVFDIFFLNIIRVDLTINYCPGLEGARKSRGHVPNKGQCYYCTVLTLGLCNFLMAWWKALKIGMSIVH